MRIDTKVRGVALAAAMLLMAAVPSTRYFAFAQAPAPAAGRQIGTVKSVSENMLTLALDGGAQVSVTIAEGARIVQLAPGSTDLKSAQAITLADIAAGDRVLVVGKAADDGSLTAARVILMKSLDIAQKNESDKADWQKRGSGGIVSSVSGSIITISSGSRKIQVDTTPSTKFRRYGADSIKFEDAKPSTLDQIQAGDQLRVRGDKSADGLTIQAQDVVSGAFKNLAGTIATIDPAAGTLTLKDLATKKLMTVAVTANSDLRKLSPEMAARFAARARGGAASAEPGQAGSPAAAGSGQAPPSGGPVRGGGMGAGARSAGGDLSQMLSRLPTNSLADLKVGDAVMIVASESSAESEKVTAVTMLSGVEPILAATPKGSAAMTLSPWNMGGGGGGEEGGGGPQ
jgi:hypothetical protein